MFYVKLLELFFIKPLTDTVSCLYLRHAVVSLSLQFCQLACTFVISHCKCHSKALILKGKSKQKKKKTPTYCLRIRNNQLQHIGPWVSLIQIEGALEPMEARMIVLF